MAKKIYKRRRSRYDPYRSEIEHLLAAGCTTGQITDAMQVHFETYITESSVYYYIRSNGLKTTVTKGARDGRVYIPRCYDCEKRCLVINTTGQRLWGCRVSDSEIRAVSKSVRTSPMWCEKRLKEGENELGGQIVKKAQNTQNGRGSHERSKIPGRTEKAVG